MNELSIAAERQSLAIIRQFNHTDGIERRYILLLDVSSKRKVNESPLVFRHSDVSDGALFNLIFELHDAHLIKAKAFTQADDSQRQGGVLIYGITYAGRLELDRLVRECAERVWWRRFRDGFFRAMLFIIPATWTVVAVLIDLFRERILAWLDGLFG